MAGRLSSPIRACFLRTARDIHYWRLARRLVHRHVGRRRHKHEDRAVLEQIIVPFVLSRFDPQRVLDIGREPYGAFYNEFYVGRELWTIDWDATKAPFGAPNHIVDDVANLRNHFPADYFGFVLMNGVFGWGLNEEAAIEKALTAVYDVLAPGGLFILGWNDIPDLVPVPLTQVQALRQFAPYRFPPLAGTSFKCATFEHTYSFYTKNRRRGDRAPGLSAVAE
jgi:SAM-dependent methyltransferase